MKYEIINFMGGAIACEFIIIQDSNHHIAIKIHVWSVVFGEFFAMPSLNYNTTISHHMKNYSTSPMW